MKPLPYILLLALCGCVAAPKQKAEIGKAEKATINPMNFDGKLIDAPPSPITANVGSQMLGAASNISAKSTQAVVLPSLSAVTLTWNYAANDADDADENNEANIVFNFYSANDLATPVSQWPLYLTVSGTNRSVTLPNDAPQRYFTATTSNLVTGLTSGGQP